MQKLQRKRTTGSSTQKLLKVQSLSDPSIVEYIENLRSLYGKYALPAEEVRRIVDKSMGKKTLSKILFQMRQKSL